MVHGQCTAHAIAEGLTMECGLALQSGLTGLNSEHRARPALARLKASSPLAWASLAEFTG